MKEKPTLSGLHPFEKSSLAWPSLARISSSEARDLWDRSIPSHSLLLGRPAGARACARGEVRSTRRQGARARSEAPPPGRRRRPGRGAAGHAPSRAEKGRVSPSGSERGRAKPSGPESVGAAASRPLSSPRLRRRRRLRGACAGRPPAGREARSAGRAARPPAAR